MIPAGVQVFVATAPIDLRYSFDRLAGLAMEQVGYEARSGALFVFFGRRRDAAKVLFFDGTGLCIFFLRDPRVPPDNNRSEAALRRVAMGRKVFLFAGHQEAGENLAGLYSLVASCELNGINPIEYLGDVLLRVDRHPATRIDELLPDASSLR